MASASRRWTRRSRCGPAASASRSACSTRSRRVGGGGGRRRGSRCRPATRRHARRALLAADGATRGATRTAEPLGVELEVETGLGRGGFAPEALAAAAEAIAGAGGPRWSGVWTHLQASEDPDRTRASWIDSRRRRRSCARPGCAPRAMSRPAAACSPASRASTASGRASSSTASSPDELAGAALGADISRAIAPSTGHVAASPARSVSPTFRPVTASATGRRSPRPTQPHRHAAARLRGWVRARALEPGRGPGPRRSGAPRRERRDGRAHDRRHRRPRPAGHDRR